MKNLKSGILKNYIILAIAFLALAGQSFGQGTNPAAKVLMDKGDAALKKKDYETAIASYKQAVDSAPTLDDPYSKLIDTYRLRILEKYQNSSSDIKSMAEFSKTEYGKMSGELEKSFTEWNRKYPHNKILLYYYAQIYPGGNYDKQEQLLLETIKLDPNYASAYSSLSIIEEARGDNLKASEYLKKAADANPQDAAIVFYYISSLKELNPKLFRQKSLEFAAKFAKTDRGAQCLYWLADDTTNQRERISVLEKLKTEFPPAQFGWSANGMPILFKDYQDTNPLKALEFAQEMLGTANEAGKKRWQDKVDFQQNLIQAQNLLTEKKYPEALSILDKVKPQGALNMTNAYILKAEALDLSGQTANAYSEVLKHYVEEPTDSLNILLKTTGGKLGKSTIQMTADINQQIDAKATQQKDLSFVRFDTGKTVSLSDYRGKVILLSFWYPFCGPCRGEAPVLQQILEKHKDKFVILSPNVHPTEEEFIMPYIKGNKYSFIPLKSSEEFAENEFNARGYPTNVLIDPQGRVVFRTNSLRGAAGRAFELQVEMLAAFKKN